MRDGESESVASTAQRETTMPDESVGAPITNVRAAHLRLGIPPMTVAISTFESDDSHQIVFVDTHQQAELVNTATS